jgi:hypothetical protein
MALLATCFMLGSCWLILRPWRRKRHVPPKRWLNLNGLNGVISQTIVLFIVTAVITHSIEGWVDPRAGLDAVEKRKISAPVGNRTPAHSYTDWAIPARMSGEDQSDSTWRTMIPSDIPQVGVSIHDPSRYRSLQLGDGPDRIIRVKEDTQCKLHPSFGNTAQLSSRILNHLDS